MDELLRFASPGNVAVGLILALLAFIVLHVFTANFLRLRRRLPQADLLPGERQLDELTHHGLLATSRMVLTDRRVVIQRLRWPFTSVGQEAVALGDVFAVRWHSGLNLLLLLAAALCIRVAHPLALLLLMLAVESTICSVRVVASFSSLPFSRPGMVAFGRRFLPGFHRFFRSARLAWSAVRAAPAGAPRLPAHAAAPSAEDAELGGFRWGGAIWVGTLVVLVAAMLQRIGGDAVSYDHLVWAPLYLGIPMGLAKRSLRDGVWMAMLSVVAVLAVKFPTPMLAEGQALPRQLLVIFLAVFVMAILAGLLARRFLPLAALLPLMLWPVVVVVDGGMSALDLRAVAITVLAMAVAAAVPADEAHEPARAAVFNRAEAQA